MVIWWRGGGLWILLLASLPTYVVSQHGSVDGGLPLAVSAVLVYLIRNLIHRDSALFSIPARFWPPLLLVLALAVQFSPPSHRTASGATPLTQEHKACAAWEQTLPGLLGAHIHIDSRAFADHTLRYAATAVASFDESAPPGPVLEERLRHAYCDPASLLSQSGVGVDMHFTFPPRSLSERVRTSAVSLAPAQCGH